MELHESLAQLARDHGESLFAEADAFRGALDDYLDEGSASTGTINLLTDAVRLGALQSMVTMLDSGAGVEDAVESAGQRLSRDRGSADVAGSQWACAVLGYALGKVPVELATRLRPDALTAETPHGEPGGSTAPRPAVSPDAHLSEPTNIARPEDLPGYSPAQQWPSPTSAPPSAQAPATPPQPTQLPGQPGQPSHQPLQHQPQQPQYAAAPSYSPGGGSGYGPPPQKKSSNGLLIGAIAGMVALGVIAIVLIIALSGGDDDKSADDDQSSTTSQTSDTVETSDTVTTDPALTLQGNGYSYQFPNDDWKDLTADTPDTTGTIDTIAAPGDSLTTARGNILVESSSAFGVTDPAEIAEDWKRLLTSSTGATPTDIGTRDIGGKTAIGVELKWTNDNDFDVHQIAYLVISGEDQYSITASFRQGDSGFKDTYDGVLDTWVWEE